jgi:hypothetical protein
MLAVLASTVQSVSEIDMPDAIPPPLPAVEFELTVQLVS